MDISFQETYIWIEDVLITGILRTITNTQLYNLNKKVLRIAPKKYGSYIAAGLRENYNLIQLSEAWSKYQANKNRGPQRTSLFQVKRPEV